MAARQMRWLAFGDVNTCPGGGVRSYVDLARAEAGALGLAAVGVHGGPEWTSGELLQAVEAQFGQGCDMGTGERRTAGAGVDLVSIMVGTFDHVIDPGAEGPRVGLLQFRDNVTSALDVISKWKSLGRRPDGGPCVVVLTPPFCLTGAGRSGLQLSQERLSEYCSVLLEVAGAFDALPVDVNTIFGGSVRWSGERLRRVWTECGDGITLNSIAHKLIYPYVRGALKACVDKAAGG